MDKGMTDERIARLAREYVAAAREADMGGKIEWTRVNRAFDALVDAIDTADKEKQVQHESA